MAQVPQPVGEDLELKLRSVQLQRLWPNCCCGLLTPASGEKWGGGMFTVAMKRAEAGSWTVGVFFFFLMLALLPNNI